MKDRELTIAFEMNYCQHYKPQGSKIICTVGMDIRSLQRVATKPDGIKWGPCIGGHTLENPLAICPKWLRRTREQGEQRADLMEESFKRMTLIAPVVSAWRVKEPIGKAEVITCPACGGRLHLSQSSYNGHVHGKCETQDCVNWME
jgi:hypothetical protein